MFTPQSASPREIASLKRLGYYDTEFANERGINPQVMAIRAWWIFKCEEAISEDLDAWLDWLAANHPDQDAEAIDMALGCC